MKHLAAFLFLCQTALAQAESVEWRDYIIYYSTFPSTLIPADVAEAHNITRSSGRIITNITVRRNDRPVAAAIDGTATNLLNQLFQLEFEEVTEQDAVYYLASQIVDETDTLRFRIRIRPDGDEESYTLEFTREYY